MSPYYPYGGVRDVPAVHDPYSLFSGLMEPIQCNGLSDPQSIQASAGPQRCFTLDRSLQTVETFKESLKEQPHNQPYYNVPCDPGCPCGRPHRFMNSLMVSADGACRGDGSTGAQASIGVFFRSASPYNEAQVLSGVNRTNQRAELHAAITALQLVGNLLCGYLPADLKALKDLELLVLKTDSEHLVKGITEWIYDWRANGWSNAKGSPVVNADLFKLLDVMVEALKTEHDITVKFLHVPRELNAGADELANRALDENSIP